MIRSIMENEATVVFMDARGGATGQADLCGITDPTGHLIYEHKATLTRPKHPAARARGHIFLLDHVHRIRPDDQGVHGVCKVRYQLNHEGDGIIQFTAHRPARQVLLYDVVRGMNVKPR